MKIPLYISVTGINHKECGHDCPMNRYGSCTLFNQDLEVTGEGKYVTFLRCEDCLISLQDNSIHVTVG